MSKRAPPERDFIIGLDWGSTSLSAYCVATDGELLAWDTFAAGVTRLDRAEMASTLAALVARWPGSAAIYASGMIGSTRGWTVAPYLDCPCTMDDLAAALALVTIGTIPTAIIPGIATDQGSRDVDVMRGEEMEAFGLHETYRASSCLAVLPGTHTKWVLVDEGSIGGFHTAMSGELFDIVSSHSLVGDVIRAEEHDQDAFSEGVHLGCAEADGLARLMFGTRARVLRGRLKASAAGSMLRGILIGAEIADAAHRLDLRSYGQQIHLLGNQALCRLYSEALAMCGLSGRVSDKPHIMTAAFAALHRARS